MKTKRICKSTVSLLLAFMMLVSMLTVGIVSAGAAETDLVESAYDYTGYYLRGTLTDWSTGTEFDSISGSVVSLSIELAAGSYTFKIYDGTSSSGAWYGNNGTIVDTTTTTSASGWEMSASAGDCTLTASGGTYTFQFDKTEKRLIVLYNAEVEEDPVYYLSGTFNSWSTSKNQFTATSTSNVYSVDMELAAGTYEFKVYESTEDKYYGNTGSFEDECSGWTFSASADNCTLTATGGTYNFSFNTSTMELTVTQTSSTGGDDGGDDTSTFDGNIYVAVKNTMSWYGVLAYCYDADGDLIDTVWVTNENVDPYIERITQVRSNVAEWGDNAVEVFDVFDVDIPTTSAYVEFELYHNSSDDKWWAEPLEGSVTEGSITTIEYHPLADYDYETELFAIYEFNTYNTEREDECSGHKSKIYTHEDFTDEEVTGYTVNAQFTYEQDDLFDNTITISPDGSYVLKGDDEVEWNYTVWVDGEQVSDVLASTETYEYTLLEPDVEYEVYIKVFAAEDDTKSATSDPEYPLYNATSGLAAEFIGTQTSTADPNVTIEPIAYYQGEVLDRSLYTYDIYEDDALLVSGVAGTTDYPYEIPRQNEWMTIHIVVHYNSEEATSGTDSFVWEGEDVTEYVTFSVGLKSSTSYRYIPTVSVNGEAKQDMTQGEFICYNANKTQDYYWYWADITVEVGVDAKITFYNKYNVGGATCTVPSDRIEDGVEYKFGYDNLNYGNTAVWYDPEVYTNDAVISFVETATHMVATSTESATLAQTNVGGTTYFMGDADCDGTLSILDATAIQLALAKKSDLSDLGTQLGDYSTNNELDIFDVTIIQLKLAN